MVLAKGAPNLMQRLSRLPAAPYLGPLLRGKPNPSRSVINTTYKKK
jgi:hypothetical protein